VSQPAYSPMTVPMRNLFAEILAHPGIVIGGPYHRRELMSAQALVRRGRIELVPIGTGKGFKAYPIREIR
jgi:hypothetical protein